VVGIADPYSIPLRVLDGVLQLITDLAMAYFEGVLDSLW
jgi:hypothetical protein